MLVCAPDMDDALTAQASQLPILATTVHDTVKYQS